MTRRVLFSSFGLLAAFPKDIWSAVEQTDPWTPSELIQPAQLAEILKTHSGQPHIVCVAFPVLYRTRHIAGAQFAGPTGKPEGIASLKQAAAQLPKNADIVLYCGCCPMVRCPNIRPAYRTLKELAYTRVRVLSLPDDFRRDWEDKGYPVEPASIAVVR
ncbi:MAG TPA: rhodanese-like domain-containing protein [Bryobacteraceae bacterium]|nr:rhodanese-like domain-containing protein [Bryobacteraceae bacterium]